MSAFLLYNIKLSCCLTLFYVGYKFLLSNETFFHFNRKILLTGMLVCALLPLVKIKTETPGIVQQPMIQLEKIMTDEWTSLDNNLSVNDKIEIASIPAGKQFPPIPFVQMLALIFGIGSFVQFCLLIRSYISLNLLIRSGRKIKQGNCTIVLLDKPIISFNYGRYIILPEKDYENHSDTILTHEMAHYRFCHSFDIVFVELLILIQWFNPFAHLLKKELRKIHEFQADAEVLNTGIDVSKYQLLLLKKAVDSRTYTFANSFNHNKLKNRFIMMSKKKSTGWARMKLLLLLPLAALSVYAFARPNGTRQLEQVIRSESTTITPTNQNYTLEFFEAELNKFIKEQKGEMLISKEEMSNFLIVKTNIMPLCVNSKDEILFGGKLCTIEDLSSELSKKIISKQNEKPILIYMLIDRETSFKATTEILNIVGKTFAEQVISDNRKIQPTLLQYGGSTMQFSHNVNFDNFSETSQISVAFFDKGKEIRSFSFTYKSTDNINGTFYFNHTDFIDEIREWMKSQKGVHFYSANIKAPSETPMGIIADLKRMFTIQYALKVSFTSMK